MSDNGDKNLLRYWTTPRIHYTPVKFSGRGISRMVRTFAASARRPYLVATSPINGTFLILSCNLSTFKRIPRSSDR